MEDGGAGRKWSLMTSAIEFCTLDKRIRDSDIGRPMIRATVWSSVIVRGGWVARVGGEAMGWVVEGGWKGVTVGTGTRGRLGVPNRLVVCVGVGRADGAVR